MDKLINCSSCGRRSSLDNFELPISTRSKINSLEDENAKLERKYMDLVASCTERLNEFDIYRVKVKTLEDNYKALEGRNHELENLNKSLVGNIQNLEEHNNSLIGKNEYLQNQINGLEEQKKNLEGRKNDVENNRNIVSDLNHKLVESNKELKLQNKKLNETNQILVARNSDLHEEVSALKANQEAVETLNEWDARQDLEQMKQVQISLKEQLNQKISSESSLHGTIAYLKENLQEIQAQYLNECCSGKEKDGQIAKLISFQEQLKEKVKSESETNTKLKEAIEVIHASHLEKTSLEQKKDYEIVQLQIELQTVNEINEGLIKENGQIIASLFDTHEEFKRHKQERRNEESLINSLEEEKMKLMECNKKLEEEKVKLDEKVNGLVQNEQRVEKVCEKFRTQCGAEESTALELFGYIADLISNQFSSLEQFCDKMEEVNRPEPEKTTQGTSTQLDIPEGFDEDIQIIDTEKSQEDIEVIAVINNAHEESDAKKQMRKCSKIRKIKGEEAKLPKKRHKRQMDKTLRKINVLETEKANLIQCNNSLTEEKVQLEQNVEVLSELVTKLTWRNKSLMEEKEDVEAKVADLAEKVESIEVIFEKFRLQCGSEDVSALDLFDFLSDFISSRVSSLDEFCEILTKMSLSQQEQNEQYDIPDKDMNQKREEKSESGTREKKEKKRKHKKRKCCKRVNRLKHENSNLILSNKTISADKSELKLKLLMISEAVVGFEQVFEQFEANFAGNMPGHTPLKLFSFLSRNFISTMEKIQLLEEMNRILERRKSVLQDLNAANEHNKSLQTELIAKQEEVIAHLSQLEPKISGLSEDKLELEQLIGRLKEEKGQLERSVNVITNVKTELEGELNSVREEKALLEEKTSVVTVEKMQMEQKLIEETGVRMQLEEKVHALNGEKIQIEEKVDVLTEEKAQLRDKIENLIGQNIHQEEQCSRLTSELLSFEAVFEKFSEKCTTRGEKSALGLFTFIANFISTRFPTLEEFCDLVVTRPNPKPSESASQTLCVEVCPDSIQTNVDEVDANRKRPQPAAEDEPNWKRLKTDNSTAAGSSKSFPETTSGLLPRGTCNVIKITNVVSDEESDVNVDD